MGDGIKLIVGSCCSFSPSVLSLFKEEDEGSRPPSSWKARHTECAQWAEASRGRVPRPSTEPSAHEGELEEQHGGRHRGSAQRAGEEERGQWQVRVLARRGGVTAIQSRVQGEPKSGSCWVTLASSSGQTWSSGVQSWV